MTESVPPVPAALSDAQIARALEGLPGWQHRDGALRVVYRFDGFAAAFGFMAAAATEAATLDHHPDWSNSFATVRVSLRTHDLGAVTELDVALAVAMTRLSRGSASPVDVEDTSA